MILSIRNPAESSRWRPNVAASMANSKPLPQLAHRLIVRTSPYRWVKRDPAQPRPA